MQVSGSGLIDRFRPALSYTRRSSLDSKEQQKVAKALRKALGGDVQVTSPPPLLRSQLKVGGEKYCRFNLPPGRHKNNVSNVNCRTSTEDIRICLQSRKLLSILVELTGTVLVQQMRCGGGEDHVTTPDTSTKSSAAWVYTTPVALHAKCCLHPLRSASAGWSPSIVCTAILG